jgi:hypothetical protein
MNSRHLFSGRSGKTSQKEKNDFRRTGATLLFPFRYTSGDGADKPKRPRELLCERAGKTVTYETTCNKQINHVIGN